MEGQPTPPTPPFPAAGQQGQGTGHAIVVPPCITVMQASKGKVEAVQCLWDSVVARMEAEMPNQAAAYK